MKKLFTYFSATEYLLWAGSVAAIILSFMIFNASGWLTLVASLTGVTSLIFCAKGNPIGEVLMIIFSLIYAVISYGEAYYGEMITYLGMTAPMSAFALVSWLKHPFDKFEVEVKKADKKDIAMMCVLSLTVTAGFYFVLKWLGTANIIWSTVSVTTSFAAVYLTYKRTPLYALAYAANDVILIVLWSMAAQHNKSAISVIVCFVAFLINDIYGFISWKRMQLRQKKRA